MSDTQTDSVEINNMTINVEDDDLELEDVSNKVGGNKAKRPRKLTSAVWNFFDVVEGKNKEREAKCKACGKLYPADSKYGTGNMKRHIPSCPRRDTRDIGQSLLSTMGLF